MELLDLPDVIVDNTPKGLFLLSSHLMGFLWSVIFHFLSKFVSVPFRIVKKLLIVTFWSFLQNVCLKILNRNQWCCH